MALSSASDVNYNHKSHDFIPVACHYDKDTLLTKNGDMIQILQIRGTFAEILGDELANIRQIIRDAIKQHLNSEDFAFWIHTVRRKSDLNDYSPYPSELAQNIHEMWKNKNYWHDKFVNTLYISVVHLRPKTEHQFVQAVKKYLFINKTEKYFEDSFEKMSKRLHEVSNDLISSLGKFGVKRLSIKEEDGLFFSEPMFLYKRIIQLSEYDAALPVTDIASSLSRQSYAVGNNQLEVIDEDGNKKFSAIISLKEYHDMPESSLDNFLRVAVEFIATEIFYFTNKGTIAKEFQEFEDIYKISKAENLRSHTIAPIMDSDPESNTSCCMQQISMMLLSDSIDGLDDDITKTSKILASLGLVHVQEDINLENAYWAQLPGNFSYIRRTSPNTVDSIAALASLHNFPMGDARNPWGKAVTLLRTEKGTPYFFNFHNDSGNGNTIIYGPKSSGHTVMMNFLLSEAMKYNPKVLYITNKKKSKIFIDGMYGKWHINEVPSDFANVTVNAIELDNQGNKQIILDAIEQYIAASANYRKIVVIDDLTEMINDPKIDQNFIDLIKKLNQNDGVIITNINMNLYDKCYTEPKYQKLSEITGCQIILTNDQKNIDNIKLLNISEQENSKLKKITAISRLFLLKQDGKSTILELSLGGKQSFMKILSANEREIILYEQIQKEYDEVDDRIVAIFNKLENSVSE